MAGVAVLLAAGTAARAQTFDVSTDFGSSVFRYGQGTAGLSFTPLAGAGNCGSAQLACYFTPSDPLGLPRVVKNVSSSTYNSGTVSIPAGSVDLHPGPASPGQDAIIEFTAPVAGTYSIIGNFNRQDVTASGNGTFDSVYQTVGGTSLPLFAAYLPPTSPTFAPLAFGLLVALNAGDVIGFAVNNNGDYSFDSTGLSASITAVPGPIAGAGLVPLFGLTGAWFARRRKRLAA